MIDILAQSEKLLRNEGFATQPYVANDTPGLLFEDSSVIGVLLTYRTTDHLLQNWELDSDVAVREHQFALRHAGQKAWNFYTVLLSAGEVTHPQTVRLSLIEENLTATRKLARGGVNEQTDLRAALLTFLPLQNAPSLEAVDLIAEIRIRASEVNEAVLYAFFSDVTIPSVLRILEEAP